LSSDLIVRYLLLGFGLYSSAAYADGSATTWMKALSEARHHLLSVEEENRAETATRVWHELERAYPIYSDWLLQDGFEQGLWVHVPAGGQEPSRSQEELIGWKLSDLITKMDREHWRKMLVRVSFDVMARYSSTPKALSSWMERQDERSEARMVKLYLRLCEFRREKRLEPLFEQNWEGIVFTQHANLGASHYAYTEGLSDAQHERHFYPGAKLTRLRFQGTRGIAETLIQDREGVIRDVDVSWDGKKIVFAWKKADRLDDYSLYEMDIASREVRAITGDLGHADYEAAYLPHGDLVFNSTRCVQIVDCWWTEVSNLYSCAMDGSFLRRLTFDQVHTNYPTVTEDGRVLYTRWDYNDRGQIYPQGLFEMFPDGTAQREFYGNNSWFPTTILHARAIPGSRKVLCVFTGHHTWQVGKLGILDPAMGRQENEGAQLIAPVRPTPAERIDRYGQEGDLAKYPYPVDERHFLVSYAPRGWDGGTTIHRVFRPVFGLYFMDVEGQRELLFLDAESHLPVGRMVPLAARPVSFLRPSIVDYRKDRGKYFIQDIYEGQGLEGVARGKVQSLRVVALEYRSAGIGDNRNHGVAGGALVSTPIAIDNGSWDVKIPLGRARVYEDGSAFFWVPARIPVYFQALDEQGYAIQSMRSWSIVQPGEIQSCVGCHDVKSATPPAQGLSSLAVRVGAQELETVDRTVRGFSFTDRIQPILDKHCIGCHNGDRTQRETKGVKKAFSLLATPQLDQQAKRYWSEAYLRLTEGGPEEGPVRWISPQSAPTRYKPYHTGAACSPIWKILEEEHKEVNLSVEELETIACWIDLAVPFCGDYVEANAWNDVERAKHEHFVRKRRDMEEIEKRNIESFIQHSIRANRR